MAEAAVCVATSKADAMAGKIVNMLSSAVSKELKLLLGVRGEIRYIKEELEIMKAFLKKAEEKQDANEVERAWVKQVRELAYDVEDCIDDFVLYLKRPESNSWFYALRHRTRSLYYMRERRRIAAQIQDLKSRVHQVSERRLRYSISDASLVSSPTAATILPQDDPQRAVLNIKQDQLVGLSKPAAELKERLLDEKEKKLQVISVHGVAGIGKTTLVWKVFESVCDEIFDCCAWIHVSQSFDLEDLLVEMTERLLPDPPTTKEDMERVGRRKKLVGELSEALNIYLQDKRYVIVFDDVWENIMKANSWERLKSALPENNLRSRILITTRFESVANNCSTEIRPSVYKLYALDPSQSKKLFHRIVFDAPDYTCPEDLNNLTENILSKCHGIPQAIVSIGGFLASNPNRTKDEWKSMFNRLSTELENNPLLEGLNHVMTSSYNELPYHLKRCFLYLSTFPKDYEIKRKHLQRLWIAEGFVRGQRNLTAEDVAEHYFKELINKSMIEPLVIGADGKVKTCRVYNIMIEVINSKSMEENLVFLLNNTALPGDVIRRVSVYQQHIPENLNLSHVRSFSMIQGRKEKFSPQLGFGSRICNISHYPEMYSTVRVISKIHKSTSSMLPRYIISASLRLLRVLDLAGCSYVTNQHLKKLSELRHLKYLSLRNTRVSNLPNSIRKLQNLEVLDIRNTNITKIPVGLTKLQQLRYLLAGYKISNGARHIQTQETDPCPKVPSGIERLKALQAMAVVNVGHKGVVKELRKLRLRKLGVSGITKRNEKDFCASLEKMGRFLHSLEVYAKGDPLTSLDSLSKPPLHLRSLKLAGHQVKLPWWVGSLKSVAKISLAGIILKDDTMKVLQALPNLVELELLWDVHVEEQLFFGEGFQSLRLLYLIGLTNLKSISFGKEKEAKVKLELIYLSKCSSLKVGSILGIESLSNLKEIVVKGMDKSVTDMLQTVVDAHCNSPMLTVK